MLETRLAAEGVSVQFRQGSHFTSVLSNLSVKFEPGEVTLLLGASGSGKTTLLSILGCLRRPDSGKVVVMNRDTTTAGEAEVMRLRQDHIGFVFQFFRLFRSLTALENVRLGLELSAHRDDSSAKARRALESVGLAGKENLLPGQLSGGERQRVALARALAKLPGVLLADEPTAALDRVAGNLVAQQIRELTRSFNIASVLATHDARLMGVADRILEMSDGAIVRDERISP